MQLLEAASQPSCTSPHDDPGSAESRPAKVGATKQAGVSSQTGRSTRTSSTAASIRFPVAGPSEAWKRSLTSLVRVMKSASLNSFKVQVGAVWLVSSVSRLTQSMPPFEETSAVKKSPASSPRSRLANQRW